MVALGVRGQTNSLPHLVNQPDVGIEAVVFAIPRTDDESDPTRVGRHLGVAGAVERDDVFRRHRAFRLRRDGGGGEKQNKNDGEYAVHVFHLRLDRILRLLRYGGPLRGIYGLRVLFDALRKRELKGFVEQIAITVRVVDVSDREVLEAILAETLFKIFEKVSLGGVSEPRIPARR